MPRFYCPEALTVGAELELPAHAARHVQVLRMQPGQVLTLFPGADARGNQEYTASIVEMGRQHVRVQVMQVQELDRETTPQVHLLAGMPSNDRMDWLVEKATELGAATINPIAAERSMLKLKGERAGKKQAHWQGIAIAACEQSGRNAVPEVAVALSLADWLKQHAQAMQGAHAHCLVLTPQHAGSSLGQWWRAASSSHPVYVLTGPEGGLTDAEIQLALQAGFVPVSLGARILRSETAPLAALAVLTLNQ